MKKFSSSLLVLTTLLTLVSCEEKVNDASKLSERERNWLREQRSQACLSEQKTTFENFKKESAKVFSSSAYERKDGFYFEYKEGTSVKKKADIRVWKQDRNAKEIYFYITETQIGAKSYFLKISDTLNRDMIDDLFTDHCKNFYKSTSVGSNGPLSVKYEYDKNNAPNTDKYTDTYSLPFNSLAVFANFRISRSVQTVNSKNENVGAAVNYSSTLVAKTYDFGGNDDASDSSKYEQEFCEVVDSGEYRFGQSATDLGFKIECDSTLPAGWDLDLN